MPTARIDEAQTLLIVSAGVSTGRPARDRGLARGRLPGAALQHLPHDHVLGLVGCDPGPLERRADHDRAELDRRVGREAASQLPERRPHGSDDDAAHGLRIEPAAVTVRAWLPLPAAGGPGARAGREPVSDPETMSDRRTRQPVTARQKTREGLFLCLKPLTPTLDTGLLTPLGAYLRLRGAGRASFLLESVEQGRLGRYSLVGSGSRLLDYEEAEQLRRAGRRLRLLRLRREARADGAAAGRGARPAREPPRRRRLARPLRSRARRRRGAARRCRGDTRPAATGAAASAAGVRRELADRALPLARGVRAGRSRLQGAHPRAAMPSRSSSRSAPSGRPRSRRSRSIARCGGSTRRRISSCSSSASSR